MRDELFARIESKTDDLVELTRDLIRVPTINPPGEDYIACAELIGDRMRRSGFDVVYVRGEGSPGDSDRFPRTNVVARKQGAGPGSCVHFNGHIDVVEVGKGWSVDPFAGLVRDGKVFGRGACDMKGGIAASIIAVEALIEIKPDFPGALEISGTVDEETGGYGGVAYLAKEGYFSKPRVDHVIIPEPLNVDRVCLGHRGVWWAEIETHGRIAHGSMPFLGDSAIRHMSAVLERFEHDLYPHLATKRTEMPVAPEGARQSTMNINSIHGGLGEDFDGWPSAVVADSCRVVLDRRYLIEESYDEVRGEVVELLENLKRDRKDFRYDLKELWSVPPTMTDKEAAVVRAVASEIETVLGKPADYVISPGTYDQKHVARFGHLHDCIAYGPGILDLAHQPNEYVGIDDLVASAKVMAASAWALLTGEVA
jgi:succinyl-diaminopimelate desuccinylase